MKKLGLLLIMMTLGLTALMAQRTIEGSVTDESGTPLPGAVVMVKGTTAGTATDSEGNYTLEVSEDATVIVFSYTGYQTQEIELGVSNVVDVQLAEGVLINDVVVTALGISRETKSLGYSVGEVDGEEVKGSGEVNAIQGLASKVAGVQVIGSGGTPGASSKILIRGNKTFTGENQPLIILDGVPYDNSTSGSVAADYPFNAGLNGVNNSNRAIDINPADIESVTVLKGPAAAALYGTRAANGVLVITTKKGSASGSNGINVDFSSSVDVSQIGKYPELQSEYAQGSGGGTLNADGTVKEAGNFSTNGLNGSIGTANSWGPRIGSNADTDPNAALYATAYDNADAYFGTGVSFENNLSISGGTDRNNFRLSYGNTTQEGIVPNTNMRRNTLRLAGQTGSDKLMISGSVGFTNTRGLRAQNGSNLSGVMLSLTRMPASFDILGGDGENGYTTADGSQHTYFLVYDNPFWSAYNNSHRDNTNRITGSGAITYKPLDWLDITYRLGGDFYADQRKQIFAVGANDTPEPTGEIWENIKRRNEINSDFIVTARRDFSEDFTASLSVGNNLNHRFEQDLFTRGRNLAVPEFYNLSNASNLYASEANEVKRLAGLFFDANFSFQEMLYLGVSGRTDWASTFGAKFRKRGFFYPSTSFSFVFTELIPQNSVLSFGKVRASYALAGIEPDPYRTATYFSQPFFTDGFTDGLSFPYIGVNGFGYSDLLGNSEITPEIVQSIEAGVDLRLWNGKITVDATYYSQESRDLLVRRPIAPSTGFEEFFTNAGVMRNTGIELEIGANISLIKNTNYNFALNFTTNKNEVVELAPGVDEIDIETAFSSIGSFAIVGDPYGAFYGTQWARHTDGSLIISTDANDPTFGRPVVSPTRGNLGNPFPDWTAGVRNTFSAYGFTLTALLDIRSGGSVWAGTIARLHRIGRTQASADRSSLYQVAGVLQTGVDENGNPISSGEAVTVNMTPLNYYSIVVGDGAGSATENSIFDGSWLRLREITLSYDLPKTIPVLRGASLFVTGRNLWLLTDYPGVDPETSLTGAGSNVNGFDYFNFPNTKSYVFGLRISL